jgi:hypothetical protein
MTGRNHDPEVDHGEEGEEGEKGKEEDQENEKGRAGAEEKERDEGCGEEAPSEEGRKAEGQGEESRAEESCAQAGARTRRGPRSETRGTHGTACAASAHAGHGRANDAAPGAVLAVSVSKPDAAATHAGNGRQRRQLTGRPTPHDCGLKMDDRGRWRALLARPQSPVPYCLM